MNDALRAAATVDPDWAKKEQRREWLVKATVAGTLLALAVGAVAFVIAHHDAERITQVEHSACQVDAAGRECQKTKAESSRAASIAVTCIPFFRAGYPCPKPGSTAAERQTRRQSQVGSGSANSLNSGSDGTAPTPNPSKSAQGLGSHGPTPPAHHQPPSKHPTSPTAPDGSEGGTGSPSQPNAPSVPGQSSAAPESPKTSEGSTANSGQGVIPSVVEGAGEAVEHVEAEVLAPTLCTVRSLLKPCP